MEKPYKIFKHIEVTREEYLQNRKALIKIYKEDKRKAKFLYERKINRIEKRIGELNKEIQEIEMYEKN